ncbi:GxxExxY protein [Salinisphaera sp.]|uniref:GxxExxY protein n=1 Tax=Salinisphaera sp. TaxID=1914330 RepID=UPI002D79C8A6|nr:GxxExxY protein [Salinisphaera sp.]HET7314140.1 GxxExxY protein [Salinisphaera sp.]
MKDGSEQDPETYAIIGAAFEVQRTLGTGFLEPVYQEALAIEFSERDIVFRRECDLGIAYKGRTLNCRYRADFICFHRVIVEIKAIRQLTTHEDAQALNYLKATGFDRALLLNFGQTRLQYRRLIRTPVPSSSSSA